jgi:hypothetical protein
MSRRLAFPAIIPGAECDRRGLAAAARASLPLQAGRRLADWFGDDPVDAESGWRSAQAQRDAAVTLGLVARGDAITDETASRLRWIYEVAYHAGYLHTSEDHELIHRAGTLCAAAQSPASAGRAVSPTRRTSQHGTAPATTRLSSALLEPSARCAPERRRRMAARTGNARRSRPGGRALCPDRKQVGAEIQPVVAARTRMKNGSLKGATLSDHTARAEFGLSPRGGCRRL